jgi:hypothetical protein
MASFQPVLDAEGNIDAAKLEKELKESLVFDVQYKQKDNMKKRAVKQAQSYDEFKQMVAAAHLKTVTSKEVESLSHAKKGWQKASNAKRHTDAFILMEEQQILATQKQSTSSGFSASSLSLPKTSAEFERDIKRQATGIDKLRFS